MPVRCYMSHLTGVYNTERTGIQPIYKNLAGTSGSRSTPKWMMKIEVPKDERRTQERMAVRLKVIRDIARTGVHIDIVKMTGTHRDLDTHNFITRRRRKVWKAGRGKGVIYSN